MDTKNIFIADDDEMLGTMLSDFLVEQGCGKVELFLTGEHCLKRMKDVQPDVVVLDYYLNSSNLNAQTGMQILDQVHKQYPGVYVIILSSQTSYFVATRTISKGATHYVIKGKDSFQEVADVIKALDL